jgi:glycine/D-amino acid oxidase-like deaminating enzyme
MKLRTGEPFWPILNGLLHTYPPLDRDEDADVAILGAGITGALVAHRLTSAGLGVVLIDARDVGLGSTAASTALLQYETDTPLGELIARRGEADAVRSWQLGLEAIDDLEALLPSLDDDSAFARRPSLYLAGSDDDVAELRDEYDTRVRHGFDVTWLEGPALADYCGFRRPAAILSQGDAEIDAYRLTHALLQAAIRMGARVYDRTTATRVVANEDGVLFETDRGPRVRARYCVCAAGYQAAEYLGRRAGALHSTWAFASEPLQRDIAGWPERCLVWETSRPYVYLRRTADGRVIMGGEDEPFKSRHKGQQTLEAKIHRLVERFEALLPGTPIEPAFAWAGVFGTTHDGLPFIGQVRDWPSTWFALGYGGNGITFSVIAATVLEPQLQGQEHPDARLFRFDRGRGLVRRAVSAVLGR